MGCESYMMGGDDNPVPYLLRGLYRWFTTVQPPIVNNFPHLSVNFSGMKASFKTYINDLLD